VFILGLLIWDICIYKLLMYHCLLQCMYVCVGMDRFNESMSMFVMNIVLFIKMVKSIVELVQGNIFIFLMFDSTRYLNVQLLTTKFNSYQLSSKLFLTLNLELDD
jgi:hypothetical protein